MAVFVTFHSQNLFQPGAYSFTQFAQGAPQDARLGVVALIGEADSGPAWAAESDGLSSVTYNPNQFSEILSKYGSGELVDAARLALNPSNDPDILGGAQQLILMKTNQSTKASLALSSSYGTIYAAAEGKIGNLTTVEIDRATINFSLVTVGDVASPDGFHVTVTGSLAGVKPGMVISGSGIVVGTTIAGISGSVLRLSQSATSSHTGATLTISQTTYQDTVTLNNTVAGLTETSSAIGGTGVLALVCTDAAASAATLTITATTLSTAITGGTTSNLSLSLDQFSTVQDLINYLNTVPGYLAALVNANQAQTPVSDLDRVSVSDINLVDTTVFRDAADFRGFFAQSQLASFTPSTGGYVGTPASISKTYLSGGALGATSQANIQTCFDALSAATNLNFLIPLFSRDAAADIADGYTDAGSTYAIASIHAATRTHVNANSTIKGRKERQAWVGFLDDSFSNVQNAAATLAAARVSMCFQQINAQDAFGNSVVKQPHMLGVVAAGMKAAAPVGLENLNKQANISGFLTRNSTGGAYFDPATDAETAIQSELTFVQKGDGGGFVFGIDNSTYGRQDAQSWYYNRPSVIYASDVAAKTIRLNLGQFVGKRNSDVTETTITNFLISVLDKLRAAGILVPDTASAGKGWTNISPKITGNTVAVSVGLVLVEGIEWVLSDISVQRASF